MTISNISLTKPRTAQRAVAQAHHQSQVRQPIEAPGALLVFLLPYAPDLNPTKLMFSKLKAAMRALAARTRETVLSALDTLTSSDARS